MVVADVPVQTGQQLVVVLVGGEVGVRTSVITILAHHVVTDASQVAQGGARDESISVTDAVLGSTPAVNDGRLLGHLTVYKEEELVLPDGATKGETVGGHLVLLTRLRNLITVYSVTTHVLVAVEDVGATAEGVGTALGDGVHATTDEVGLTHVVGRNHNLHFLDCLD